MMRSEAKPQTYQKPSNILYGVDDQPPLIITILQGLQHICVIFISVIFPVLIIKQLGAGISVEDGNAFISLSLLAGGIATIVQSLRKGTVGSGYLCPSVSGPAYFDATRDAALIGGLPMLFGMTTLAGVIEIAFSRIVHKLRAFFPAEVTGLAVAMVGIVVVPVSVRNFLVLGPNNTPGTVSEIAIAVVTLTTMIVLNTYVKGKLRLYSALVGIIIGYILAFILGEIPASEIEKFSQTKLFALPYIHHMHWTFDFSLIIPFTIATICSTLKTMGDLVTCQKINDANWRRPDMKNVGKGIFADGIGGLLPGLIGGYGQSTSSSNVGLSLASGITSRIVAFAIGGFLMMLAFLPKLAFIFLLMPRPVMGASLIFAISFMIISGIQIITSRMLDARKIFVVGVSFILGLSVDMVPGAYAGVHPWLKPVFESSLSLALVSAIILNLFLRIGIAKKQKIKVPVDGTTNQKLTDFMDLNGKSWGALQEIIQKTKNALVEFNEAMLLAGFKNIPVIYEAVYNEFNIDINITYAGEPFSAKKEKPEDWLKAEDKDFTSFAMNMVYHHADKVTVHEKGGYTHYRLHFIH